MNGKKIIFSLFSLLFSFLLLSCLSDWAGEETGAITLTFGTARAAAWPDTSDPNDPVLPLIEHKVILENSAGTKSTHPIPKGSANASIPVAPGTWDVSVEAFLEGVLFASGSGGSVEVKAGQSTPAPVTMNPSDTDFFIVNDEPEWNAAKTAMTAAGKYCIVLNGDFSVAGSTNQTFTAAVVTIIGNHSITLSSNGYLLFITSGQSVTLQDVALKGQGLSVNNTVPLVDVDSNCNFTMKGAAKVSGNFNSSGSGIGGGVAFYGNTLTMSDSASITGNKTTNFGGGVEFDGIEFIMSGNASITGNEVTGTGSFHGGAGVHVGNGSFTMNDNASIYGNIAANNGGGILIGNSVTFTMKGNASVYDNTAGNNGGGVCVTGSASFSISGGAVVGSTDYTAAYTKNTATNGAALYVETGTATYGGSDGTANDLKNDPNASSNAPPYGIDKSITGTGVH
jgi:hypothetical protein